MSRERYECSACFVRRDERRDDCVCPLPGCGGIMVDLTLPDAREITQRLQVERLFRTHSLCAHGVSAPNYCGACAVHDSTRFNLGAATALTLVNCVLVVLMICGVWK